MRRCKRKCQHCKKTFKDEEKLRAHKEVDHCIQFRPCFGCVGVPEFDQFEIRSHHLLYHRPDLKCPFCPTKVKCCLSAHIKGQHRDQIGMVEPLVPREDWKTEDVDLHAKLEEVGCSEPKKLLTKEGYLVAYDEENLHPDWTMEVLTAGSLKAKKGLKPPIERILRKKKIRIVTKYKKDKGLPYKQITSRSITYLKYANGHLAASANHRSSLAAYLATFIVSNIVPMIAAFNTGVWSALEKFCRSLTRYWKTVTVFSGPIYDKTHKKLLSAGCLEIPIPSHFFKVVYLQRDGENPLILSFIIPHKRRSSSFFRYLKTLEEVEQATGIDFLTKIDRTKCIASKGFRCNYSHCDITFATPRLLDDHRLHCIHKFRCLYCPLKCDSKEELSAHYQEAHLQFECNICQKKFVHKNTLNDHMATHSSERKFKCTQCPKAYKTKNNLGRHIKSAHTNDRSFPCPICKKIFHYKGYLKEHMESHSSVRKYKCNQCGKGFKTNSNLINHVKTHSADKRIKCKQCEETFKTKDEVSEHVQSAHSHKCDICGKVFGRKDTLEGHLRSHTGEKPFECNLNGCGKAYPSKKSLKRHQKDDHQK